MENKVTKKQAAAIYRSNNNRVIDDDVDGFVVLKDVNKVYDNRVQAVFDFNLSVAQNEFIVLVGPSGCGKSTTLRMIAGLEEITSGYLYIDRVLSNYLESKDRDIAMVFQSYALYPNMTVYDNIGFGLKVRGASKEEIKDKVFEAADVLDLGAYLDRRPRELSGGQMQRVALGRAIVRNAKLFLMDEPLSNLDAKLRVQMRSEIVKLHKKIHATTVYVTHDQTEAMTMADRIVIMNKGVVQQIGTPMEIYNDPSNVFVATFIGSPPMNVFEASVENGRISFGGLNVALPLGAEKKYKDFIAERRRFFEEFAEKAKLDREKALVERISAFSAGIKKLSADTRAAELDGILAEARALSEEKGFFKTDDERESLIRQSADAGDIAGLKRDLVSLAADIKASDLAVAGILKRFDSAGMFGQKKDAPIPQQQKKPFFKRLFAKKEKPVKVDLATQNAELIARYLSLYGAEDADRRVYVGLRPEDVHFAGKFDGNASEPMKVKASFVELLGSEFCAYIDAGDTRIILKDGIEHMIKADDEIEICFDMDKLKLFDCISCRRVDENVVISGGKNED